MTAIRWHSRGIGRDYDLTCFVCGRGADMSGSMHNVAAIVSKADENAVLACFERGARMAYYHGDRSTPQVKIGACDAHRRELEVLASQWFVSSDRVRDLVNYGRWRTVGGAS